MTLDHPVSDSPASSHARLVCGSLRCTETLTDVDLTSVHANRSRQLTSVSVYRARISEDGTSGRWQRLASVTPQRPSLDQVSDSVRITGQLSDQQATLSLQLVKTHDCQESQFSCVVISEDNQGRTSVKKSFVGKGVDSQEHVGPESSVGKLSGLSGSFLTSDDQSGSAGTAAYLANLVQLKLDLIEARLETSLMSLESRLEDKVGDLRSAVSDKIDKMDNSIERRFGAFDLKIGNLENRLEDKLDHLDGTITVAMGLTKTGTSNTEDTCGGLASKLDNINSKLEEIGGQNNACVAAVAILTNNIDNSGGNYTDQLDTVITFRQSIERYCSSIDHRLEKLETATDQCVLSTSDEDVKLAGLASSIANLSGVTQNLVSEVNTLNAAYSGGALQPVEEFFDLLGTGKKEWRLVFRGTSYINNQVYPAYIHGTGIPLEVEAGCKQFNRSLPCVNHYRNRDAFDNWTGVDEVLFAVYKDDQMVHKVVFNGKGSTYTDWFAADKVTYTSWRDLTTKSHAVFSIFGEKTAAVQRRFFMNFDYDRGCKGFRGWFYAGDLHGGCAAEQTIATPVFRYAKGNTLAVWSSQDAGHADAIGVFLKYQ